MKPDETKGLLVNIDTYVERLFAPHGPVLEHAPRCFFEEGLPGIQVSPSEGNLLQMLAGNSGRGASWRQERPADTARSISRGRCPKMDAWSPWISTSATRAWPARISRAGLSEVVEVRVGDVRELLGLRWPTNPSSRSTWRL